MTSPLVQDANDFPVSIRAFDNDDSKFDATQNNIETLWDKLTIIKKFYNELLVQIKEIQTEIEDDDIENEDNSALKLDDVIDYLRSQKIEWDSNTYTTDANGNVTQILYKRAGVTKVTWVNAYNAYMNISTVTLTGEIEGTWTYSYDTDNQTLTGTVKT